MDLAMPVLAPDLQTAHLVIGPEELRRSRTRSQLYNTTQAVAVSKRKDAPDRPSKCKMSGTMGPARIPAVQLYLGSMPVVVATIEHRTPPARLAFMMLRSIFGSNLEGSP